MPKIGVSRYINYYIALREGRMDSLVAASKQTKEAGASLEARSRLYNKGQAIAFFSIKPPFRVVVTVTLPIAPARGSGDMESERMTDTTGI